MGDCLVGIPSRRCNKHPGLLNVSLPIPYVGRWNEYLRQSGEGWEYTGTSHDTVASIAVS